MYRIIYAFSKTTKEVMSKLADRGEVVVDHLIKVFLWPNSQEYNHWKQEVWSNLNRVSKLKTTNRFPTSSQIYNAIWDAVGDMIPELAKLWIDEIDESPIAFDFKNLEYAIHDYLIYLSKELSTNGIITSNKVYSKLDVLTKEYFNYEQI